MSEELDDRPEAKPIPVANFEGEFVRKMEAKLPAIALEMEAGYARGTHLKLEVEVRVRNVRFDEITSGPDKGELSRQHLLAIEEVKLVGAFSADELDPGVGGSASAAAIGREPEPEDPEGAESPQMSDCSWPKGEICQDPACPLHAPARMDVGF